MRRSGEAELAVGCEAFAGDRDEDRDVGVVVVVHGDSGLGRVRAEQAADVLDDLAFERHGEGEHESVEPREVEAFSEVAAGSQRDGTVGLLYSFAEGVERSARVATVLAPDEQYGVERPGTESPGQRVEVALPLGEDQHATALAGEFGDVSADLIVAGLVGGESG